jgi:hypothetical protein
MEGKPVKPTLELLVNSSPAIAPLDPGKKESAKKIRLAALAWNTFLESASEDEKERARPMLRRFIDRVSDCIESTDNTSVAASLLQTLNLPNLFNCSPHTEINQVFDTFFKIFKNHGYEEKGRLALLRLERNSCTMLFLPPHLQFGMANELFDFYADQRHSLYRLSARKTAKMLSGHLLSKEKELIRSGQLDLLGYAVAWAPLSGEGQWDERVELMERISRGQPVGVQVAVFAKLIDAVRLMPPIDEIKGPEHVPKNVRGYLREMLEIQSRFDHAYSMLDLEGQKQVLIFLARKHLSNSGANLVRVDQEDFPVIN